MQTVRQIGSGLLYALVSVVLVVGGLSLALAERSLVSSPTPSPTVTMPETSTSTLPAPPSTPTVFPTTTPAIFTAPVIPSPTYPFPTFYFVPTATLVHVSCGPFFGWIRSYMVQPGDTLFHIATLYRTTVYDLERANCKTSSAIFAGERLWVPNVPTVTPGLTIIPTFVIATPVPTEPLTSTPLPFTETVIPTDTAQPGS